MNKIKSIFLIIIIISSVLLAYIWYKEYSFKTKPLSKEIQREIYNKEKRILALIKHHYSMNFRVPIIISDKLNNRHYGITTIDSYGNIQILLNKKRFKENKNYMIDDVLPHEYAHALAFKLGHFPKENGGHTLFWENICKKLEGARCNRFVNNHDILLEKTSIFK